MANIVELRRVVHIQGKTTGVKEATGDLKQLDRAMDGVTIAAERTTRATLSEERALRALQTRLDPAFRATERLAAAERTLTAAQAQGLITLARKNELMALASAQTDKAAASTSRLAAVSRAGFGLAAVVTIGVAAVAAIKNVVDEASALVDTADKIGITTTKLQELHFAAGQTGVEISEMDSALSFFNKAIGEAARGGGDLVKILRANGVALRDQAGDIRPLNDLMLDYADLVRGAASAQDRTTLVTKAFGRANDELINTLSGGSQALRDWAAEAQRSGLILEDGLLRRTEELGDRWDKFTAQLTVGWQTFVLSVVDGVDQINAQYERLKAMTPPPGTIFGGGMSTAGGGQYPSIVPPDILNAGVGGGTSKKVMIDFEGRFNPPLDETIVPEIDKVKKAVDGIPTPRTRASGLVGLREQFERAEKSASSFTETLVSGLIQGEGIVGSLTSAIGSLSSNFGNLASGFLSKLGGGGIVGSILGGLGGGIVSSLVSGIGGLIDSIFGGNDEEERAAKQAKREEERLKREEERLKKEEKRQEEKDRRERREDRLERQEERRLAKREARARQQEGYADRAFTAGLDTSTLGGSLAAFDREAQREREEELRNGGKSIVQLEQALAAERLAIIQDFAAQALAEAQAAAAELVASARDDLQRAYEAEASVLRDTITGLTGTIERLKTFADGIRSLQKDLLLDSSLSPLNPMQRLDEARRQFTSARPEDLQAAARAYLTEAKGAYASSSEYAQIFGQVQSVLDRRLGSADTQIGVAQQQLSAAEKQLAALDEQVSALLDVNQSVLSVADAIHALHAALAAQSTLTPPASGASLAAIGNTATGAGAGPAIAGTTALAGTSAANDNSGLAAAFTAGLTGHAKAMVNGFNGLGGLVKTLIEENVKMRNELVRLRQEVSRPDRPLGKKAA